MKPSEIKKLIKARFEAGIERSIIIEASPGVGKTELVGQCASELGVDFMCIHAPMMQPEDYGFPVINASKTDVSFIVSKVKFPVEGSACADKGIFLIDELPQADNAGQKVLANLVQAREIHGQRIKKGWMIVSTGNRQSDRSGANRVLSHLRQRFTTLQLDVSLDDWTQWAIANGVKPEVVAFIRFRPNLLNCNDSNAEIYPNPRSWVQGVSAQLGVIDSAHEFPAFSGDVGEGAAAEFIGFLKVFRKLPSPDAILLNPDKADVPNDPSTLYALCGALARKADASNFGRLMLYIGRLPAEFSVLFVRDVIQRLPAIQSTPDFMNWASGAGAKLLS